VLKEVHSDEMPKNMYTISQPITL